MRDVNNLPGLHALRSMFSTKKRSMPKVQSSPYLDLFMLGKEKERLMKEDGKLSMRAALIKKRLEEIEQETSKLQETEAIVKPNANKSSSGRTFAQTNGAKKEFKTMALTY